jgi:hypothetical protein
VLLFTVCLFHFFRSIIMSESTSITTTLIPEKERLTYIEKTFGMVFPLRIEPFIYSVARHISEDYNGGYWHYHSLSNGGFWMHPESGEPFDVISDNGYTGSMQPEAFGITCCLYSYSNLSFYENKQLSDLCTQHYHLLRDFVPKLSQAGQISAVCD